MCGAAVGGYAARGADYLMKALHAARCFADMRLVLEEVFYGLVGNHLLVEDVCTRLGAFYHLDYFGVRTPVGLAFLKRGDCFLCHSLLL